MSPAADSRLYSCIWKALCEKRTNINILKMRKFRKSLPPWVDPFSIWYTCKGKNMKKAPGPPKVYPMHYNEEKKFWKNLLPSVL